MPLALLESLTADGDRKGIIVMLEPRRLAAAAAAARMAAALGQAVGCTVGYRVRHDSQACVCVCAGVRVSEREREEREGGEISV